jgi:hypothetical protein
MGSRVYGGIRGEVFDWEDYYYRKIINLKAWRGNRLRWL